MMTSNSSVPCSTDSIWSQPVVEMTTYSGFEPLLAFQVAW